ncbi:MAG: ABC transporter substrate-binding protein [Candidatus Dormibacteraeota bacterium]|nr:ABC transporter substrate-binding protein [Candidatus Dormibacteraeota bacterium]
MLSSLGRRVAWRSAAIAVVVGLLVSACASTATATSTNKGGVVTFAEPVGAPPNYIFPLLGSANFNVSNLDDVINLMYPELYTFGTGLQPVVNTSLSMAQQPVFSQDNTVVTITLKHWKWSNGQPVTARDVMFWLNLLSAATDPKAPVVGSSTAPGPGWGAEVPGGFPENVVSYSQVGEYSVVLHLNASYNPTWYLYNELSQIWAIPQATWDKLSLSGSVGNYDQEAQTREALAGTSPAEYVPANPGTATTGALGVAEFLNLQAQDLSTYQTNPLWQVVSGPFRLSQFTPSGFVKLVPNQAYSGSPKPKISAFEEEPFTSDTSEFNALNDGSLSIGYLPVTDINQKTALGHRGYTFNVWNDFAINYSAYNFTNATSGPIFKQLYFRQAFQSLIDQKEYIKDFGDGIGSINNGPVPGYPPDNVDESPLEAKGQVYPFDPAKAVSLLKDNGWDVIPSGQSYCAKPGTAPGDCGSGIASHQALSFKLLYASGITPLTDMVEAMQSTMKSDAGIALTLVSEPSSQVEATSYDGCTYANPCNNWDIAIPAYNFDWVYGPDYLPTGGELFGTGAASNQGDYSSPTNDANIAATHTAATASAERTALFRYQDYLAENLPVIWLPNEYYQLTMYRSTLKGVVPQSILDGLFPQFYSYSA